MLDQHLEEIVKLAFTANASEAEYHFRKYLHSLHQARTMLENQSLRMLAEDPDYDYSRVASLDDQAEKITKEILRLETLMSSAVCK